MFTDCASVCACVFCRVFVFLNLIVFLPTYFSARVICGHFCGHFVVDIFVVVTSKAGCGRKSAVGFDVNQIRRGGKKRRSQYFAERLLPHLPKTHRGTGKTGGGERGGGAGKRRGGGKGKWKEKKNILS